MKKMINTFSIVVIALFAFSVFGWMSVHLVKGDRDFGFLNKPVEFMYTFPDLFSETVKEVKKLPDTFMPTPAHFEPVNKLDKDLVVLVSYSEDAKTRIVSKMNLKNNTVLQEWRIDNPSDEHQRIFNPILHPDGSLIYSYEYQDSGLHKVDAEGNLIWKQDSIACHHGMNLAADSNIWASTKIPGWKATGKYSIDGRDVYYLDYTITKIDHETGNILFHKSISEILKENNMSNYILKAPEPTDPLHSNDVQPALKSTKYYRKDDVFISIRNLSMVLHYRPSTNELVNVIEGPFSAQHDVDIINDSTIAIFNNNYYAKWSNASMPEHSVNRIITYMGDFYSNIVAFDLSRDTFSFIDKPLFVDKKIFTGTEGLLEFLDDSTYFVEEQNSGVLWVVEEGEVIYENVLASQHEGHHHLPNWTRIIEY